MSAQLALKKSQLFKHRVLSSSGPFAIIGDVHGCGDELTTLLNLIFKKYPEAVIISLGDLVDRGPLIGQCVKMIRSIGAYMIMGNHEEKLVRYSWGNNVRMGKGQLLSVKQLDPDDYAWFQQEAYTYIEIPAYNLVAVHGGFIPGLPLEKQDLKQVIRLRNLTVEKPHRMPHDGSDKQQAHWSDLWYGPQRVIYGHSAWDEVQITDWTYGIDTGCVYGRKLTAAIFANGELQPEFIQVDAKKQYWEESYVHNDA